MLQPGEAFGQVTIAPGCRVTGKKPALSVQERCLGYLRLGAQRRKQSGGRLLIAERARTRTNMLTMGISALNLSPAAYWRELLRKTGFVIRTENNLSGLIHCFRADKPVSVQGQQLQFDLNV